MQARLERLRRVAGRPVERFTGREVLMAAPHAAVYDHATPPAARGRSRNGRAPPLSGDARRRVEPADSAIISRIRGIFGHA